MYRAEIKNSELKEETDELDSEGANWYQIEDLKEDKLSPFEKYALEKRLYRKKE